MASDDTHKDPAQRAHVWERPQRVDERPPVARAHADYQHELPRWLHKDGDEKFVTTPAECDAATRDGWVLDPNGVDRPVPPRSLPVRGSAFWGLSRLFPRTHG